MLAANNQPPKFTNNDVSGFILNEYGIKTKHISELGGYIDQNFHLVADDYGSYLVKIHQIAESPEVINFQEQAISHLDHNISGVDFPTSFNNRDNESYSHITDSNNRQHILRLLNFVTGEFLKDIEVKNIKAYFNVGQFIGKTDAAFSTFSHAASNRSNIPWDMKNTHTIMPLSKYITDPAKRRLVDYFFSQYTTHVYTKLIMQRMSIVHGDMHGKSILVENNEAGDIAVSGAIDFGDMTQTYTICNLATAAADVFLDAKDPIGAIAQLVKGYHFQWPLHEAEVELLYYLIANRMCTYACMSAYTSQINPDNKHAHQKVASNWKGLRNLIRINPIYATDRFKESCGMDTGKNERERRTQEFQMEREKHFSKALYTHYDQALFLDRGALQYLYDQNGMTYLDCVDNVSQWGHCHPRIVHAVQQQAAQLNTNSRYIYEQMTDYAKRLTDTLPAPLSVCYFVNSGSEANDLAIRLARTITKQNDIIVVDTAYHGNSTVCTEISPHRIDRPGRPGLPEYVHKTIAPNTFEGPHKSDDAGTLYADDVNTIISRLNTNGLGVAAFIAESLIGTGGQIVLPEGYLKAAYAHVHKAGGITIADEVQVGFGRTGQNIWCFEDQGVVPDIVTMGKPMGNGHPMAAVVTTPEIAAAFDGGVPFFNTFGGNPVSCAVGLAVLDVLETEEILKNVIIMADKINTGLHRLAQQHSCIVDIRGLGLYVGVEFQTDNRPDAALAGTIVEAMKLRGILLNTNGYNNNVIKIKPPLIIDEEDVHFLIHSLSQVLNEQTGNLNDN